MRIHRLASRLSRATGRDISHVIIRRGLDTIVFLAVNALIILAGHAALGAEAYQDHARAPLLLAAAIWIASEGMLMFLRTQADLWDRFSWALFIARWFTSLYLLSQTLSFAGLANYPGLYWDVMRNLFGTSAALIGVITIKEIISSLRSAPPWRRRRAWIGFGFIVAFAVGTSFIW